MLRHGHGDDLSRLYDFTTLNIATELQQVKLDQRRWPKSKGDRETPNAKTVVCVSELGRTVPCVKQLPCIGRNDASLLAKP